MVTREVERRGEEKRSGYAGGYTDSVKWSKVGFMIPDKLISQPKQRNKLKYEIKHG